jgi:hypothetical protein
MDLIEIINNFLFQNIFLENVKILPDEVRDILLTNSLQPKIYHSFIVTHGIFPPYDNILFNPYFQMIIAIIGAWIIDDLFDILFLDYIKRLRRMIIAWIKNQFSKIFQH